MKKQQRYFFEVLSTADLNNHQAWIIRCPNAGRVVAFQLAEKIAPKVLVDALQIDHWAQLAHTEIPGQIFLEPLTLAFLIPKNETVELRIRQIKPLVLEDCDLVFTEGRGARALGWIDVMEGR